MGKFIALFGLAVALIFGVIAYQDSAATRPARTTHTTRMLSLEYQQERRWQENHQPYIDMMLVSVAGVMGIGAAVFTLAVFGGVGLAIINWARGLNFERRYAMERLRSQERVAIAAHQYQHALPVHHYAPHISYRGTEALPQATPEQAAPGLPGVVDLAALAWQPSEQALLLGLTSAGNVTVSARQLMHVAFSGATGSGKSNAQRLLLAQLLAIGSRVVLCNPIYTDYDAESGEDWKPITARLHMPPARSADEIDEILTWLLEQELPVRLKRLQDGVAVGHPLVLALDELPMMVDMVPKVTERVGKLLRMGRHARIYTAGASQDFLIKTLGGSSGIRDCYRTAYYSGGDILSAAPLLDLKQREIAEGQLGQGVVYLRSSATTPAQLVRVPYASNEAVYRLLGQPAAGETPETAVSAPETTETDFSRAAAVARMRQAGMSKAEIIKLLWGAKPGGSRAYKDASAEYDSICSIS
jgi:hypothetical protein